MRMQVRPFRPQLALGIFVGAVICIMALFSKLPAADNLVSAYLGSLGTLFLVLAKDGESDDNKE